MQPGRLCCARPEVVLEKDWFEQESTYLFVVTDLQKTLHYFFVRKFPIAQNRTTTLNGIDDLAALIARKAEACRIRIDLHRPSQRLLGASRHTVCFVEDDDLMAAWRQGHLLLRKALDLIADNIDSSAGASAAARNPAGILFLTSRQTH